MFKALYQKIKNIPASIKNYIQLKKAKVVLQVSTKNPEFAKDLIRRTLSGIFYGGKVFDLKRPLITIKIDGQIYEGEFDSIKSLLKSILSKFPCVPKGEAFAKLSAEEAKEVGQLALIQSIYDQMKQYCKFLGEVDPLPGDIRSVNEALDFISKNGFTPYLGDFINLKYHQYVDGLVHGQVFDKTMKEQLTDLIFADLKADPEYFEDWGASIHQAIKSGMILAVDDLRYLAKDREFGVFFV